MQHHATTQDLIPVISKKRIDPCPTCQRNKNKASFHSNVNHNPTPSYRLYFDLITFKHSHLGKHQYYLACHDNGSAFGMGTYLAHKDKAVIYAIQFLDCVKTLFNIELKIFRCDPGELGLSHAFN
ncbi:UNVERIFIED_CONTAM: hypothetical protein HDU68_005328 [Siphonaria sp. JEL0065]|nr:hypothetical protein HDU68_005328 [Siphonaria sp. JEL0065]